MQHKMHPSEKDETQSLVIDFDSLVRNSSVLQEGEEHQFLEYVKNSERSRQRWELAELECQRLSIELTKSSQEVTNLMSKLEHARSLLDKEAHMRKKAENERDRLASRLNLLHSAVMESRPKLEKNIFNKLDSIVIEDFELFSNKVNSPKVRTNKRKTKSVDVTEGSVLNVEDLSYDKDDTAALCESRYNLPTASNSEKTDEAPMVGPRRSQRLNRAQEEPTLKRSRRSKSCGGSESVRRYSDKESPLKNYKKEKERIAGHFKEHSLGERTVMRPEKCDVCSKRIKFGKICLKCNDCKVVIHSECKPLVGLCNSVSPTNVSSYPHLNAVNTLGRRISYATPNKKEKPFFASPIIQ